MAQFTQARSAVLDFARRAKESAEENTRVLANGPPKKRRKLETQTNASERRSTRSQSRNITASQQSNDAPASQEEVQDSDDTGSVYHDEAPAQAEPHDGQVACPSCGRRMKEALINSHLDRCLAGDASSPPRSASGTPIPPALPGSIAYSQTKPSAQKDRLPTLNYSMFTEASLRKKLKELGITNTGSKELMRKRHIEWINLWNANCDAHKPKTKRDLLRELDVWERTLGRQIERGVPGVMIKDFDRENWQKSNRSEFEDLIRQAKERRKAKVTSAQADSATSAGALQPESHASNLRYEVEIDGHRRNAPTDQRLGSEHPSDHLSNCNILPTEQHESLPGGSTSLQTSPPSAQPEKGLTELESVSSSTLNGSAMLQNDKAVKSDMAQGTTLVSAQPKADSIDLTSSPVRDAHDNSNNSPIMGRMFV